MTKEAYKNRRRTKKEAEHINEFAIFQVSYDFNEIAWNFYGNLIGNKYVATMHYPVN